MVDGPSQGHLAVSANSPRTSTIKFLCSYGGKILPRYPDHKLRYLGGETRVLAVDRSICFADLQQKLRKLCGVSVFLRCQLPKEDLDSLVSITSDEDLANLIEEYDHICPSSKQPLSSQKIRAFLSLPMPIKQDTSPSRATSSLNSSSLMTPRLLTPMVGPARCLHQQIPKLGIPGKRPGEWKAPLPYYPNCVSCKVGEHHNTNMYLIHNGNHWQ
ncbi:hypothetical protein SAY87_016097 [Trapa incisa]|uniref:PB1 domain-containing protein n=1 Tax=Trapa incisa TaxID=236973 RepID=A0AAN7LGD2_9MYRT|nr:hypothetical protein SAY87_016097 [Trapa incisa]